jgi:hypothetical protein
MFLTDVFAARAERPDDTKRTLPSFVRIAGVAPRAKPKIHGLAHDRGVRSLPARGHSSDGRRLLPSQLNLLSLHAIMMAED